MSTRTPFANTDMGLKSKVGQVKEFYTDFIEKTRPVFEDPVFRKIGGGGRLIAGLSAIYPWVGLHILPIVDAFGSVGSKIPESFMNFFIKASTPAMRLFIATMNVPHEIFPKHATLEGLTALGLYSLVFLGGAWWGSKQIYEVFGDKNNQVSSKEEIN